MGGWVEENLRKYHSPKVYKYFTEFKMIEGWLGGSQEILSLKGL